MIRERTTEERLIDLEHAINGNGAIGIKEQLQEIRESQKKIQKLYWMGMGIVGFVSPLIVKFLL